MDSAFWDASSIVPICVPQRGDLQVRKLTKTYKLAVWWSTSVEIQSAFARLYRMQVIDASQLRYARARLDRLRRGWSEIQPSVELRQFAETFLDRYELRAADSLQLAAAYTWAMQRPKGRIFIGGDQRLLEAAKLLGFQIVSL